MSNALRESAFWQWLTGQCGGTYAEGGEIAPPRPHQKPHLNRDGGCVCDCATCTEPVTGNCRCTECVRGCPEPPKEPGRNPDYPNVGDNVAVLVTGHGFLSGKIVKLADEPGANGWVTIGDWRIRENVVIAWKPETEETNE